MIIRTLFELLAMGLLDLFNDSLESLGVVHSQIGQHLAVDFDTCLMNGTHKLRIVQSLQTGCSVDTLDPQGAELSLLVLTVTECIGQTFFPSILGNGPDVLSCTKVTSGKT